MPIAGNMLCVTGLTNIIARFRPGAHAFVSFMYPHALLSSSRFCFFLFSLSVECTVQDVWGKFVPLLVCMLPKVLGPGSVHGVPWCWQLFWEDFCKPLEKRDLSLYQGIESMRTLLISSGKKPAGGVFKSCLSHLQGLF